MPSLEERITQLMESKSKDGELLSEDSIEELAEKETIKTKGGTTITDDDESTEAPEDDESEEDKSEEGDDKETDMSKDPGSETKKNKFEVKEGTDPFGSLDSNGGDSAGDAGKNAKLKSGLGRKEDPRVNGGKLTDTASADKSDDNGDNARIKAGLSKKETTGKLADGATGSGVDAANAKNAVDKNPQGVKEHMVALFNGEELSEEFQAKAATIFEAAVGSVAQARIDALQEEYAQEIVKLQESQEEQLNEAVEEIKSELVENIDDFLNVVVEQWIVENQVELESGMKVEMVNGFIDGLKTLFKEHYVDIPEDRLDVIEEQSEEIEELSATVNSLVEENNEISKELITLKSALVFESVTEDLTVKQAEKFSELVENVEFTTEEEYTEKLNTLKENYFSEVKSKSASVVTEESSTKEVSDDMSKYISAIGQPLRFR